MLLHRNCRERLMQALSRSPAVLLTGARQTGKTTLAQAIGRELGYGYVTFDNLTMLAAAQSDPHGFLAQLATPVIIDEAQRVPELFYAIKKIVDEKRVPGTFLLTGSTNPLFIPRLGDALVGRLEIVELQPFSQGELNGHKEQFIDTLFDAPQRLSTIAPPSLAKADLFQKILVGGYPLVQTSDPQGRDAWFDAYVTTLLYRDVQELSSVTGLTDFPRLLRLLATRAGNLANVAELGRTIGLPTSTLHRYLALLEALFLLNFQPPWHGNLTKRLVKAPKLYLNDTGLLSFLLAASPEKMARNEAPVGGMLENFVVAELKKQASWSAARVTPFHFRTQNGTEIDIVLERNDGRCAGIEIKASDTVSKRDFEGLHYLSNELGTKMACGVVLYTGSEVVPFGTNLWALPIASLWSV